MASPQTRGNAARREDGARETGWLGELDSNRRDAVDLAREARSAGVFRNLRQEDGARETGWLRAGFEPSLWRRNLPCFCATALLATLSE
jgi:hypothetical protein